jgi:PHD/YefM family antitoxin component YafN of YafNO toxin-antitoxin module
MKTIEIGTASGPLIDSIRGTLNEPLVVTNNGTPTAVLLPLDEIDLESLSLGTNPDFLALIERSRARAAAEGGISSAEMRRRVLDMP